MEPQTPAQPPKPEDESSTTERPVIPTTETPLTPEDPAVPPQVLQPTDPQPQLENPGTPGSVVEPGEVVPPVVPAQSPKKKKWLFFGLIAVAIVALGGASAAAYVGYFMPRQPKYVLARALGNTVSSEKIKSARYEGDITVKSTKENQTFKGSFDGAMNDSSFELNGSVGLEVTTLKFDVRAFKNKSAYVKIDGLKGLPELLQQDSSSEAAMLAPYINAINGQWIELDQSLMANFTDKTLDTGSLQVSDADAKKIEGIYRKHPYLEVTKVHADEAIHGAKSHHYTVVINRDKLYAFAKDLKSADIKNFPNITDSQLSEIKKANFSKYPVDVWVDAAHTTVSQVSFTAKEDDMTMTLRMAFSDINKSVTVTKPTNTKTLMQILSEGNTQSGMDLSSLFSSDMSSGMNMSEQPTSTQLNALTN